MQSLQTVLPRLFKRNCWTELWAKFLKSDEEDVFHQSEAGRWSNHVKSNILMCVYVCVPLQTRRQPFHTALSPAGLLVGAAGEVLQ